MLYIVSTPIGNLKDITLRALETLKSVDFILCEDTRHSLKLLNHYGIKKQLIACHKFNERECALNVVQLLKEGKDGALISDAGTPCVSDPGGVLIQVLRENGMPFTVVPGAAAFVSALVLSGFGAPFSFVGFLPERKNEREERLARAAASGFNMVFYCAPHDVKKICGYLFAALGERRAAAVREITKIYESVEYFNLRDGYPGEPKGEFVLIVEGKPPEDENAGLNDEELIEKYIAGGMSKMDAVKRVAKERKKPKSELYSYTIGK